MENKKEDNKEPKKDKKSILAETIKILEKEHGKGVVMRLGDKPEVKIDVIDTGSLKLNDALGIGGWPRGRIVEIYGLEMSGKSTLCLHAIANAQKAGGICAFIDAEHALDNEYASNLGVDIKNLYINQPDNGEQGLEVLDSLVCSRSLDLIVVDSVAALVPKAEIEGNMGDAQMALQARLMSQAMRKLTGSISKTNTCVIFTNQLRMKIGVTWGNPETTCGGNALKFYASIRIDIRRGEAIKKGEEIVGSHPKIKVAKNKLAAPFKTCTTTILFGQGIVRSAEILELAVDYDIVEKSGSWYSYGEERIGQGMDNVREFLKDNPKIEKEIEDKVVAINTSGKQKDEIKADTIVKKTEQKIVGTERKVREVKK